MSKKLMYLFALLVVMMGGCSVLKSTTSPPAQLNGVNVGGGELDYGHSNTTNPVSGTDYLFASNQDVDYLVGKKVNFMRVTFSWEAMQPALYGPLSTGTYAANMKRLVDYATSKGVSVMIEPHGGSDTNFAAYKGNKVGTAAVPNAAFADFWGKMAVLYGNNPKVIYGLSNEPCNMGTMQWMNAAAASVSSIRAAKSSQMIMVPGNGWSGASSWTQNWYDTTSPQVSNATAWTNVIKDPLNNTIVSVHNYFDANAGGTGSDVVSPTVGADRMAGVVAWARANKLKIHVSEIGTPNTSAGQVATANFMNYVLTNSDVIVGFAWWINGDLNWWGGNQLYIGASNASFTADDPKMAWLTPFFYGTNINTTPTATTTSVPPPPVDAGVSVVDAGVPIDAGTPVVDAGVKDAGTVSVDAGVVQKFSTRVDNYVRWTGPPPGSCSNIYITNLTSSNIAWHNMVVSLGAGGSIRDSWNIQPITYGTKTPLTVLPDGLHVQWIAAKSTVSVGFCQDNGTAPTVVSIN